MNKTGSVAQNFRSGMKRRIDQILTIPNWLDIKVPVNLELANNPSAVRSRIRKSRANRCRPIIKDLQEVMKKHAVNRPDALHCLDMVRHYDYDDATMPWENAKRHVVRTYHR